MSEIDAISVEIEKLVEHRARRMSENVSDYKDAITRIARIMESTKRKLEGNIDWETEHGYTIGQIQSEAQRLLLEELSGEFSYCSLYNEAVKSLD